MRKILFKTFAVLMAVGLLIGCIPISFASAATATQVLTGVTCDRDMVYTTRYRYWQDSGWVGNGSFGGRYAGDVYEANAEPNGSLRRHTKSSP